MSINSFNLYANYSNGELSDLGACPGQPEVLKMMLEAAEDFTNEHKGLTLINADMAQYLGEMINKNDIFGAILGAYSLGYKNGYKQAGKDRTKKHSEKS